MSFYRTLRLGVLGALLALGLSAVPTTANAVATFYSTYSTWDVGFTPFQALYLCQVQISSLGSCSSSNKDTDSPYSQIPSGTGTPVGAAGNTPPYVPLTKSGTPLITLSNTSGVPMYRNIIGTSTGSVTCSNATTNGDCNPYNVTWSSFWPNELTSSSTANPGDVWATNCTTGSVTPPCSTGGTQGAGDNVDYVAIEHGAAAVRLHRVAGGHERRLLGGSIAPRWSLHDRERARRRYRVHGGQQQR